MTDPLIPRPIDLATPAWAERPVSQDPWRRLGGGLTPHRYQRIDSQYVIDGLNAGRGMYLGWEMGLGKTLGAAMVIDGWDANFNLVICPNSAKAQWANMLRAYCPWLQVFVIGNSAAHRERAFNQALRAANAGEPFALICHYEAVKLIEGANKRGWLKLGQWDLVVVDEAHQLKGTTSKRAGAIRRLKRAGMLMLSGSVMSGNLEQLFTPLQMLRPLKYKSKHRDWISPYMETASNGFAIEVTGPRMDRLPQLRAELGEVLVVRRAKDHLDIPTPHIVHHDVELLPEQERIYNELVTKLMAELPDGDWVAVEDGATLMAALRQVTAGVPRADGTVASAKHDKAMEIIESAAGSQLLAFTWHKAPGRELQRRCGEASIRAGLVNGDVPVARRTAVIEDFKAGEMPVLAATISTLGVAANLQNASAVLFIEESYDPVDNEQAVGRVVRQGQSAVASVHYIRAIDTVDGRVLDGAMSKADLRRLVLGA